MAAVLCFLFLLYSSAAVTRVTTGEVARYEFKAQTGNSVGDATGTLGPLVFSNNVTWLVESSGIRINKPGSLQLATITPAFASSLLNAFSFEFWMSMPPRLSSENSFLMSIGNVTGADPILGGGMPPQSVALSQTQDQFQYLFETEALTVLATASPVVGLTHWVFTSNFSDILAGKRGPPVFLNATQNLTTSGGSPPPNYPLNPAYPLQIAPFLSSTNSTWYGDIHHFSIYSRLLTPAEVLQNFQAGPADSAPYATDLNFTGPMDTPLALSIQAFDLDFVFPAKAETQNCTLNTIPALGTLTAGGVPVQVGTVVQRGQSLTYLGESLGWGMKYANFTFNCIDSTGRTSQNATTTINLLHVDHPPTPNNLAINAVRANKTILALNGSNLDYYPMGFARVTRLPTNGSLYLDTKPNPTLILANTTLPVNITSLNTRGQSSLFYLSDNTSGADAGGQAILFNDSFEFQIASKPNGTGMPFLWSTSTGVVNISVTNNLFSQSSTVTLAETTPNTTARTQISLPGTNSLGFAFYGIIQSLPSHGQLFLPGSDTPIAPADLPLAAGTNPARPLDLNLAVEYMADFYYYGNDTFTFQLNETETGWLSAIATMSIKVTPVNQRPEVLFASDVNMTFLQDETKYVTIGVFDRDNETSEPYDFELTSIVGTSPFVSLNISVVDICANTTPSVVVNGRNLSWVCVLGSLHNVSLTAAFFGDGKETNATGLLRVTVTDRSDDSDTLSLAGVTTINYTVVQKPDDGPEKINQLRLYLQWGGIGVGIAAVCFCCCIACGRYQRYQVRKAMSSNTYGGEATSLDRL